MHAMAWITVIQYLGLCSIKEIVQISLFGLQNSCDCLRINVGLKSFFQLTFAIYLSYPLAYKWHLAAYDT